MNVVVRLGRLASCPLKPYGEERENDRTNDGNEVGPERLKN